MLRVLRLASLIFILLLIVSKPGQTQSGDGSLAVRHVAVIDVRSGAVRPDQTILVSGGIMTAIGASAKITIPSGIQVLDGTGKYVIPGMADMHNHVAGPPLPGSEILDPKERLHRLLAWGITTVFGPGMTSDAFRALKGVSVPDSVPYPHFYGTGPVFTVEGGHVSQAEVSFRPVSEAEAREDVRKLKADGVDVIKLVVDDFSDRRSRPYPTLSPELQSAIIDEAHRNGLKAYAHALIYKFAKKFMELGGDGLVHGIADAPVEDDFIALMKKRNAPYITTLTLFEAVGAYPDLVKREVELDKTGTYAPAIDRLLDPGFIEQVHRRFGDISEKNFQSFRPVIRQNVKRMYDAGVLVVAGSDTPVPGMLPGVASQMELNLLSEAGLTPLQALRTATINAQTMIGRSAENGSVDQGKRADLVILRKNPLADIRNVSEIEWVIKKGVAYKPAALLKASAATYR